MNPQKKLITIVNITSKSITPRPGQNFRPFTIWTIFGNDGKQYESTSQQWVSARRIGENVAIEYVTQTRQSANGQVYHTNKIQLPNPAEQPNIQTIDALRKVYSRIEQMEKNIIACIEINTQGTKLEGPLTIHEEEQIDTTDPGIENSEVGVEIGTSDSIRDSMPF